MDGLLSAKSAAAKLGIATTTLYDWIAQSDAGAFAVRGQSFSIDYYQGGRRGQGRIRIEAQEVERLMDAMRVLPPLRRERKPPRRRHYPGITVPLGRLDDD